jgi:hypothetical protein
MNRRWMKLKDDTNAEERHKVNNGSGEGNNGGNLGDSENM